MAKISFYNAEQTRLEITKEQEEEIANLYKQVYKDYKRQMDSLPLKGEGTASQSLQKTYLNELTKQLKEAYQSVSWNLESQIEKGMLDAAGAVVEDNDTWMKKAGIVIKGAYSYVPKDIVYKLSTGKVYGEGWTLSKSIWGQEQKTLHDIDQVIAMGVAGNKSAYEIAKDLEKYVNPSAQKEWDWSKVYPGTNKKVDYNAQRLARTMVSHSYQQSLLATTRHNPFVHGYKWRSAHTSRTCEICNERDGKVYSADDLPLDHPNGLCTFLVETDSLENVADRLADWALGKDDAGIDEWYQSMYGIVPPVKKDAPVAPSTPPISDWLNMALKQDLRSIREKGKVDLATLTPSERRGIKDYTGNSYEKMNSYLRLKAQGYSEEEARRKSKIKGSQLSNLEEAQKGLDSLRTTDPLILKRGSDLGDLAGLLPGDYSSNKAALSGKTIQELNDMLSGSMGTYSSFLSTTPDPYGAFYTDVDYVIYAPSGTRGAMVESISQHAGEKEFLVSPNTKILVRGVEDPKGARGASIRVFLEIIPEI